MPKRADPFAKSTMVRRETPDQGPNVRGEALTPRPTTPLPATMVSPSAPASEAAQDIERSPSVRGSAGSIRSASSASSSTREQIALLFKENEKFQRELEASKRELLRMHRK